MRLKLQPSEPALQLVRVPSVSLQRFINIKYLSPFCAHSLLYRVSSRLFNCPTPYSRSLLACPLFSSECRFVCDSRLRPPDLRLSHVGQCSRAPRRRRDHWRSDWAGRGSTRTRSSCPSRTASEGARSRVSRIPAIPSSPPLRTDISHCFRKIMENNYHYHQRSLISNAFFIMVKREYETK